MYTNARVAPRPGRSSHLHLERRWKERRHQAAGLIFPERRTGFDRRTPYALGPVRRAIDSMLRALHGSSTALLTVLALVNLLNLLDYVFTINALSAGMSEGNPIMQYLFNLDVRVAGLVKVAAMAGVTFVIWKNRRYKLILGCALVTLVAYLALLTYHLYGAAMFY